MSDQLMTGQNQKANYDNSEMKALSLSKQNNSSSVQSKQPVIQSSNTQQESSDKKTNAESTGGNSFSGSGYNMMAQQNQSSQNSSATNSVGGGGQLMYDMNMHSNSNSNSGCQNQHAQSVYQRDFSFYSSYNSNIQFCKNHPNQQVTKICLQAGCALTREICDECEKQPPHSSHPQAVVDAKKFYVDVELSLKEFRVNSPLMNASEMLEQGRQFIQRHFQSMNNMLVEKSPSLIKILALIEQTESAKRIPMKTYELERFIRDIMGFFHLDKSGKLEQHSELQLQEVDIVKEEINGVLLMLRDLENVVRFFHDDFAKALKFGDSNNTQNNNNNSQISHSSPVFHPTNQNENKSHSKAISELGSKLSYNNGNNDQINNHQNNYSRNFESNSSYNNSIHHLLHQKENGQQQKSWGQQYHNSYNHSEMGIQGKNSINQKNEIVNQLQSNGLLSTDQLMADAEVLMDPAFLKRPRGRPKGSKCKRKGKYKGKYSDGEKLSILQEVATTKSVQLIAEKYSIQNSLIRYWARQLKYQLDPQTISSRRPYRTFSREQKKIIVQEAIKKRDIVLVAQEYDVNAQVLKRWILKSASGALQTQEMRQMMNAVPNGNGEYDDDMDDDDDNSQSQDDSNLHSGEDEDDDEEDDDEEEDEDDDDDDRDEYDNQQRNQNQNYVNLQKSLLKNDDNLNDKEKDLQNDQGLFVRDINRNQENLIQYKQNKKDSQPTSKESKKTNLNSALDSTNSNSLNNIYNLNDKLQQNDSSIQKQEEFDQEIHTSNNTTDHLPQIKDDEQNNSNNNINSNQNNDNNANNSQTNNNNIITEQIDDTSPENKSKNNKLDDKIEVEDEEESDEDDSEEEEEESEGNEPEKENNIIQNGQTSQNCNTSQNKDDTHHDEDDITYSQSSKNLPTKKIKPNEENNKSQLNEISNQNNNIKNKNNNQDPMLSPKSQKQGKNSLQNKNTLKIIDQNVNEILNLDVLKSVDLKNLDLSVDTFAQSEKLQQMKQTLEEELLRMKQQQQEIKIKKQIHEQKKQLNPIKSNQPSHTNSK